MAEHLTSINQQGQGSVLRPQRSRARGKKRGFAQRVNNHFTKFEVSMCVSGLLLGVTTVASKHHEFIIILLPRSNQAWDRHPKSPPL